LQYLSDLITFGLVGQSVIPPVTDSSGHITAINGAESASIPGQAITVNSNGAFFNSSYQGFSLTTDRGKIEGGTAPAQLFILLHELGHNTNALTPDANKQTLIDQNDKSLEQNCKQTIKGFSE